MTKDAIWPACLDLYDVCFIVSRYRKSFFPLRIGHLTQCRSGLSKNGQFWWEKGEHTWYPVAIKHGLLEYPKFQIIFPNQASIYDFPIAMGWLPKGEPR
jgi:hypothetical protein